MADVTTTEQPPTDLTTVHDPEALGLDPARLRRVDALLTRYVDEGLLPGWQLAITRHGRLAHLTSHGHRDVEAGLPVTENTIFRIYSMTKVVTCVAALALWEQGAFQLNDPVTRFIPSFEALRVWRGGSTLKPDTEPLVEPMRVWHLFAHTSGLTYGFLNAHCVDALYRDAGLDLTVPDDLDLAGVCDRLARLPLLFQPGTEWNYGMSTDVLGRVVEVAAGRPLADVIQDVVLDPLGMVDTCWHVPSDRRERLAALYVPTPGTRQALRWDVLGDAAATPPTATLGGGGLCSTTADYLRFAGMLARRGELDGTRILAPTTVDYMASNHLPDHQDLETFGRRLFSETTFDGVGFGLGVMVVIDPQKAKVPYSLGEFGWGGAASTVFAVDPVLDLTFVFMTQLLPSDTHPIRSQLRPLIHAAVLDA
jgi:CubicO group peptidase (beta-lactamase class C family)